MIHTEVPESLTNDEERMRAEQFCRENDLPLTGFVCLHHGKPFQWQNNSPRPESVVPGVVAVGLNGGARFVAKGGSAAGANRWENERNGG